MLLRASSPHGNFVLASADSLSPRIQPHSAGILLATTHPLSDMFQPSFITDTNTSNMNQIAVTAVDIRMVQTSYIPSKFLATSSPIHNRGLRTLVRTTSIASPAPTAANGDVLNTEARSIATDATTALKTPALETPASASSIALPELPKWVMAIFVAWMGFMLVVTVVLFLAQFPSKLELELVKKRCRGGRKRGYVKVSENDESEGEDDSPDGGRRMTNSAATSLPNQNSSQESQHAEHLPPSSLLRKRRGRILSIDTHLASPLTQGLGIAVRHRDDIELKPRSSKERRLSYDEEALRLRAVSPVGSVVDTLTAPLFGHDFSGAESGGRRSGGFRDVEMGTSNSLSVLLSDFSDIRSSSHFAMHVSEDGSGILARINAGIYGFADTMSRTFFEHVGAEREEQGLLLPVKNEEREKPEQGDVFVEVE